MLAVNGEHQVVVLLLLKANANIHVVDCRGKSALQMILELKPICLGMISALFKQLTLDEIIQGITRDELARKLREAGYTLRNALLLGNVELMKVLLNPEDVNDHRDCISDQTLLHTAVRSKKVDIVKVLLEFGADIRITDRYGLTPLDYLYGSGIEPSDEQAQILKILLSHSILLPWMEVTKVLCFGDNKAIRTLIEANVDFYATDFGDNTMLHFLAQNNKVEALKMFANLYLDVNEQNDDGYTPLDIAAMENSFEALKFLLENGANINHDFGEYVGTLYFAFEELHMPDENCVRLLLKYGADPQTYAIEEDGDRTTIFDVTIALFDELENVDLLTRVQPILAHLAVLQVNGTAITELTQSKIKLQPSWLEYFEMCERHADLMRKTVFYGNLSLLVFLTESEKKIVAYVRNKKLVSDLEQAIEVFEKDSPYPDLLRCRLEEAIEFAELREKAVVTIGWILGSKNNSHSITAEFILEYLNRQDMENLICSWRE